MTTTPPPNPATSDNGIDVHQVYRDELTTAQARIAELERDIQKRSLRHTTEKAILQNANAELQARADAAEKGAAEMRAALESAPEPVCAADSPRGYEKPHMVVNFSAVDRWWVITRSKALESTTAGTGWLSPEEAEKLASALKTARDAMFNHAGWNLNHDANGKELPMTRPIDVQLAEVKIDAALVALDSTRGRRA